MDRQRGRVQQQHQTVYFLILMEFGINLAYELTMWHIRWMIGIMFFCNIALQIIIMDYMGYTSREIIQWIWNIWPLHLVFPILLLAAVLITEDELFPPIPPEDEDNEPDIHPPPYIL